MALPVPLPSSMFLSSTVSVVEFTSVVVPLTVRLPVIVASTAVRSPLSVKSTAVISPDTVTPSIVVSRFLVHLLPANLLFTVPCIS